MGTRVKPAIDVIADRVRSALDAADLEQFADLLDPKVTWGAPGDPSPPCQSRAQVLAWYSKGREAGRRGQVRTVRTHGDKIVVAMTVTSPDDAGSDRWQVLTVANGRVADIRGYDGEAEALEAAGLAE